MCQGINASSGGGGPYVSFSAGLGVKGLGVGLTLSSGNEGYYFSLSGGQITGLSLVAGWNFADPSAGITTEATIAGGKFVGGSFLVVNELSGNSLSLSPSIGGGFGVGFSTGLTATTTWQIYSQPAPATTRRIHPSGPFAPDNTRYRRR